MGKSEVAPFSNNWKGARMHDAINATVILLQMRQCFEVKARVRLNLNGQALSVGSWRRIVRHADRRVKDQTVNARQTVESLEWMSLYGT